jgi:hypothetical protein
LLFLPLNIFMSQYVFPQGVDPISQIRGCKIQDAPTTFSKR